MRPVELHVERLVVPAALRLDPIALQDALERELSRLVAERGIPRAWATDGLRLDGLSARVGAIPTSRTLGRSLAETIHRGRVR